MKVNVKRVGHDGEGIAYKDREPIFIYYAYKNEEVEIDLFKNKRNVYEGDLKKVLKPSSARVKPECPYYGVCGGCNLMHIDYFESLKYKRERVIFLANTRLKNIDEQVKVNLTIPSDEKFNYRNKLDIPVKYIDKKNKMGFFQRGSINFLQIDKCLVQEDILNDAAWDILELMNEMEINAYSNKYKKGFITHLSLRVNDKNEIQVAIVLKVAKNLRPLARALMRKNKNIISVYESYVPGLKTNRDMFDGNVNLLTGDKHLAMHLDKYEFYLTPNSFFQLNTNQATKLYKLIVNKAQFKKDDVVLDAYSGVGTIGSFISPHVEKVVAIEAVKDAVRSMNESLKVNNINNIKTITGDVIKVCNYLKTEFDVMVFDPPRVGLGKTMVDFILKKLPRKVVYVSCDPETLIRDLNDLVSEYDIQDITPLDMFPQTSQVETVTILNLKK